ncbi:MAG: hydrogenase maturation protease [candidate division WOR-3 bacterium]
MKKLLLGLGNEYCGNDALGIIIAQRLKDIFPDYELKTGAFSGIDFLEAIEGFDEVIVIDSFLKPDLPPGSLIELRLEDFAGLKSFSYLHSLNFANAVELGRQLNIKLPQKIKIFGIVVDKKGAIGEEISVGLKKNLDKIMHSLKSKI